MRWHRAAATGLAAAVLTGCGGAGEATVDTPSPAACQPTDATLPPGASMAGMDGRYAVRLVSEDGRTASADLSLVDQPDGMRRLEDASTPLGGTIEIDLESIGAQPVGDLDSTDPEAPGVLVLESDGAEGRTILLRLGSEANQRGRMSFDGAFTVLYVQRMDGEGFSGAWWSGVRATRTEGHFCAYPA